MTTKRYYTVVYEVTGEKSYDSLLKAIEVLKKKTDVEPIVGVRLSSCGEGDYATERDAYGQQLELQGMDKAKVFAEYLAEEEENAHDR